MSEYKKLRVGELQAQCERRGIDPSGLNKRGLINALRRNDSDNDNYDVEGIGENGMQSGRDGEVDDEIQFRVSAQRRGNGDVIVGSAGG